MIVGIIPYVQSLIDSLSKAIDTVMVKSKEWEDAWNRLHPKGDGILDTIKKTGMAWIEATGELNKYGASWNAAMRGTDTFSSRFDAAAGSLLSLTGQAQKFLSSSLDIDKTWKSTSDEMADLVATAGKATTTVFPKDPDKGAIAAQMREIDGEIAVLHQGLERKKVIFDAEAKQFAFTQNQKFASLQAATSQEYQAELALLEKEKAIGDLSVVQAEKVNNKIKELKAKHETDMVKLDEQSIAAQMAMWHQYTGAIESAFNSQLRGMLSGTVTWAQAFKNILGELLIKFIGMMDAMLVKAIDVELAKTTAAVSGAAARTTAETAAASTSILAQIGNAFAVITADAAKAFAGVFAFLAPEMGPAAAGPAGEAGATVLSAAAAIPSAAIGGFVLKGGLASVHANEAIVPARMAQPFAPGMGGGGDMHVHVNLAAWDGASVHSWLSGGGASVLAKAVSSAMDRNIGLRPRFA